MKDTDSGNYLRGPLLPKLLLQLLLVLQLLLLLLPQPASRDYRIGSYQACQGTEAVLCVIRVRILGYSTSFSKIIRCYCIVNQTSSSTRMGTSQ